MTHGHVTVVGSINADLTVRVDRFPGGGETLTAHDLVVGPGGKGANQALAAARSGAQVRFVGAVGDDAHRDTATSLLAEAGVDLSGLQVVPGTTGTAHITVDAEGENTILVVAGGNAAMDAAAVDSLGPLDDVVVLQGEIPRSGVEKAAELTADGGGRLVVNLAPVIEVDAAVILGADPLIANEHEVQLIARMLDLAPVEADDVDGVPADVTSSVAALRAAGVRTVVVTLGASGALVADEAGVDLVPSPKVDAVDTTGAGDAFTGALAAAISQGVTLRDAVVTATRFAAASVLKPGAQASYPSPGEELPS